MTTKLILGFIGNGKSANRYHLPFILSRANKITTKTIYSATANRDSWDKLPNITYTNNLDVLLGDPEIQVVVVSTPAALHYEFALKVLQAGKHCVVEKPFTQTSQEAETLYSLAKEKGLMVQCYQNRRFDSDFLTTQKVIESGKLGDLLEVEMHYDYYRPYIPESVNEFSAINSYLYGHGCHTLDQVISYFGAPDHVNYDVRQLLGDGRMNDYFDVDMFYGALKVSVKSSYFRIKERPSFVAYGKKGMFIKHSKDKQEHHLKLFYMPDNADFGQDTPEDYGVLTWMDDAGIYHEEKVVTEQGDYARYYDALYETIINGKEKLVKDDETLLQINLLQAGIAGLK
ncbi:UNVERIFIED_ORG: putative dehydrogenase [Kosakonia oryzae]|uniref:Predicted dehydrogenase n=1 Tax=Kosakonia radicincitans TaxID=283686 RepID=A0AAX2EY50_9ENTR|nr:MULTISPECIES: Gfo/Idh/MocA family oxidoreductase [Enterobacterales]MDP9568314.1 putative dehydrogenase [Kosakonia oryzae]MDY4317056.1 Gfo/Idh/MocA family oxidoreductase [Pectobacterium actinidiae]SFF26292.1 Predicted dehydrogenase [Kosakonia radicincitans]SFR25233.1 Predicted dehydrogenase [Kosakonia radicincitans]SFU06784.1 Predicted dehydrogenase [Kosakonia radicincitans]